jgi:hypothetical protein
MGILGTLFSITEVYLILTAEARLLEEDESKQKTIIDFTPFLLPLY